MDGGAATAAIEVLVQNLINISKEEMSLFRDLEKNSDKLRKTLATIQSLLGDAEKKLITNDAVKGWIIELEAVAFDADNALDELNYHLLSKTMKREKKKVPSSCFPSLKHCLRRRQMALKIREINMTFESINNEASKLGLVRSLADATVAADDCGLETNSFTVDPIFIGRDSDVSEIVEMLTRSMIDEQVLSILPIVGMGGLGKTTLARNVFNHEKIKTRFGEGIWVHVPKIFDSPSLLKKILSTLTSKNVEVESSEVVLKNLQEALKTKTYLLVLDDVWNQDRHKWEDFINSWSGISSVKGNRIIVTTRVMEVASIVHTLPIYELRGLPGDNCWSIIKAKAFGEGDVPPGLERIGRNIAERCQSLPLAANVVGGLLRGKSEDEWLSIEQNWLSDVDGHGDNISKILKLSYDHLSSSSLKKCFAYCSIFPKGARIHKEELIELWMAEGFLQPDHGSDMEIVGNKFFDILLQNSLLQVVTRDDYDNITDCTMHDLVHDLASSILGCKYYAVESGRIPIEKAKCLRTLFFKGEISDITFSDFKSLHVLNLEEDHVEELSSSIEKLIHLRCLNISNTSIKYLPNSIDNLYHMQTLRGKPEKLPDTLKHLINLRHLHVPDDTELPSHLGMLTSLQTLPCFKVRDAEGHRIVELGSLNNLKGNLKIENLEKVVDEEEAERAHLFRKPCIVRLALRWDGSRENGINDENVLAGLQPHPNLKMLEIFGFKGRRFPPWTLKMVVQDDVRLNNLMEIRLENLSECEAIPMLGHLPRLKSLFLCGLRNVKSLGPSFYGIDYLLSSSNNGIICVFPALKRLELSDVPNLTEWVEAESHPGQVNIFPCLAYLQMENCKQLRSAPSQFSCLKELANITCGIILTIKICGLEELERLPERLFYNNQNLSELCIKNCPKLRELPDGLHTLNSLQVLEVRECPDLMLIPGGGGGFTSLRSLSIWDCEELAHLPCEMIESCVLSLQELHLGFLSSLTNLQMIVDCLHKMPNLTELEISYVPEFVITSTEIVSFCSLQTLTINLTDSPYSSWDCVSFRKVVGRILGAASQSLCDLNLSGVEDWDALPDELQHLTALTWLSLYDFGIEELPEWFGNLTSLKVLHLNGCKKLRSLPSVEAMRRLTNLFDLFIFSCPVLKERCIEQQRDDDGDSEWPKISHLPYISVDDQRIRYKGRTEESYRHLDDA